MKREPIACSKPKKEKRKKKREFRWCRIRVKKKKRGNELLLLPQMRLSNEWRGGLAFVAASLRFDNAPLSSKSATIERFFPFTTTLSHTLREFFFFFHLASRNDIDSILNSIRRFTKYSVLKFLRVTREHAIFDFTLVGEWISCSSVGNFPSFSSRVP